VTVQVDKHAAAAGTEGFLRQQRPRYGEWVIRAVLFAAASVAVITTVAIVVALLIPTLQFFAEVPITDFLFGTTWSALGSGMSVESWAYVRALAVDGSGNLYAGGQFSTAGGVSASGVDRRSGAG
jgi:hypothetical protein